MKAGAAVGALAAAIVFWPAESGTVQTVADFEWHGRMSSGQTLEIKGVNGGVRAVAASGSEARVTARKHSRRDDPESVEIKVIQHAGGVTVCAVYPTPRNSRRDNECAPGDGGRMNTQNNDVSVEFEVQVPAGVRYEPKTVNGDVDASGLRSDVLARTVNGGINIATSGLAEAVTVNGSIEAELGRADWKNEARFKTVNGSITLYLPAEVNAEVRAKTVNGDISTDYPLTVRGRFGPRSVNGTLGRGGPTLELETVNGGIALRRGR
jgi:hypothetical protein